MPANVTLMRCARSLLFGIEPLNPIVIGAALEVFVGTAIIARGLPPHRAAAIDPIVALRHD